MKEKHKRKLKKGSDVWVTTLHCTGNGKVVKISDKRECCHVECGGEIYTGIRPHQIEISDKEIVS